MCSCVTNIEFMQQRTFVAQDESNRLSGFDIDVLGPEEIVANFHLNSAGNLGSGSRLTHVIVAMTHTGRGCSTEK